VPGNEVPERAPEAAAGALPAILGGEGIEAPVNLDESILLVDYIAEARPSDRLRG
jgi:hypothetical protein